MEARGGTADIEIHANEQLAARALVASEPTTVMVEIPSSVVAFAHPVELTFRRVRPGPTRRRRAADLRVASLRVRSG